MCRQRPFPLQSPAASWMARLLSLAVLLVGARPALAQELVQALPLSVAPDAIETIDGQVVSVDGGEYDNCPPIDAEGLSAMAVADRPWTWQVLPDGILYPSYLAGTQEPRLGSQWFYDKNKGWLWDIALGARAGLVRYGTTDPLWPEGWQFDIEGAAFPRLSLEEHCDMASADFRAGAPLTYRRGIWETKFGYYHLSSHLGDEYMLRHKDRVRINYSRDALVFGMAMCPGRDWRLYGEVAWAFYNAGGSQPWEFQFGASYAPANPTGFRGAPFMAVNGHLHQEVNFGGNLTVQAGWAWRGDTGRLFRMGLHYLNGKSDQAQFYREFEQQIGAGLWYDF